MKRPLALVGALTVTVGVLAGTVLPQVVGASSHREAPMISKDPSADNTDVYAFVTPGKTDTVTLIANYIPAEEPAGGPNFYEFDPAVLYAIHVVNDFPRTAGGDVSEITYEFRFNTKTANSNTFLYNTGPISFSGGTYQNWNRPQTYSVTRVNEDGDRQTLGENLLVPRPVNIGPRSTPNYDDLAHNAVKDLGHNRMVFAGQRDDPFFVDLGSIFDLLGLRPFNTVHKISEPTAPGVDDVGGLSVHSIVLQVPKSDLTRNHVAPSSPTDDNAVIGVYATASRRTTQVLGGNGDDDTSGRWVQISRLGEPLINEVLIPLGQKDKWNGQDPQGDSQFASFYLNPEPARLINALYNEPPVVAIDEHNRSDLVAVLLTGIPGLNNTGPRQMDVLRLNMGIAPTAAIGQGDPLGVLKGDLAGYPNGRRLEDDVVDIEVRAIAQGYGQVVHNLLGLPDKSPNNLIGDGDNANDKAFSSSFPYVSTPKSGYDPTNHVIDSTSTEPLP